MQREIRVILNKVIKIDVTDTEFMNTSLEQVVETVHKWYRYKLGFNIYKSVSHQDQYTGPYHVTMWPNSKLRYRNINFTSPLFMVNSTHYSEAYHVIGNSRKMLIFEPLEKLYSWLNYLFRFSFLVTVATWGVTQKGILISYTITKVIELLQLQWYKLL